MWEQEKLETKKLLAACAVKSYKNNVIMPQESKSAFHSNCLKNNLTIERDVASK